MKRADPNARRDLLPTAPLEATPQPSRRHFLKTMGVSGVAGVGTTLWLKEAKAEPTPVLSSPAESGTSDGAHAIDLTVNGASHRLNLASNAILLDVIRDQLQLAGTKKGCDHGQCGACTVLVNGVAVNACLSIAVQHDGDSVTTIEGLAQNGRLHPVQEAFWEHDAYQCGYCTSGQIMSAVAILADPDIPADDASVREAMSGNICRCAAYKNILSAIQSARVKMGGTV